MIKIKQFKKYIKEKKLFFVIKQFLCRDIKKKGDEQNKSILKTTRYQKIDDQNFMSILACITAHESQGFGSNEFRRYFIKNNILKTFCKILF